MVLTEVVAFMCLADLTMQSNITDLGLLEVKVLGKEMRTVISAVISALAIVVII